MNVRLTPELQTLVQTKVKAGLYPSANDLVCEAVRLLDRRDRAGRRRLREIREQIDEGWFSLRAGESVDGEEFFESLERRDFPAGRRVRLRLLKTLRILAKNPQIGHHRPDLTDKPLRFWPEGSYLIVYDPAPRPIEIVRVIHGARDVASTL
jgi:putative addiction module CopG family antidote